MRWHLWLLAVCWIHSVEGFNVNGVLSGDADDKAGAGVCPAMFPFEDVYGGSRLTAA
jgi:hypothetical protein